MTVAVSPGQILPAHRRAFQEYWRAHGPSTRQTTHPNPLGRACDPLEGAQRSLAIFQKHAGPFPSFEDVRPGWAAACRK